MTTINSNAVVELIDTSSYSGNVILPSTTDIPNRILIFKDSLGTFNINPFIISTTAYDSFDNYSNRTTLTTKYDSICLYSDPTTFTWRTLFSYNTANDASNWSLYPARNAIAMNNNDINGIHGISAYGSYPVEFASAIDMKMHSIDNVGILYAGGAVATDVYTNSLNVDVRSSEPAISVNNSFNMHNNQICNIQVNYCNTFSNTSIVPSLIATSPQSFSGAIFDQTIAFNSATNCESNYLYFERNQSIWKIHITVNGFLSDSNDSIGFVFSLSNCSSGIETPLIIYGYNNPFIINATPIANSVSLSLNDTVNLSDIINSSITPYTPITLNMYCFDFFGLHFVAGNIVIWLNPNNQSDLINAYAVAYGNNTWIAGGQSSTTFGYIATSYDNGNTWTGTDLSNYASQFDSVAYGNGVWLLGCYYNYGNCLLYSTDGTNFTPTGIDPSVDLPYFLVTLGIAYGNGIYVAVGIPNDNYITTCSILYSTNGINWNPVTSFTFSNGAIGVSYGNGIFVAVGSDTARGLATSQDGINWITPIGLPVSFNCVTYGAGKWFAFNGIDTLYYSSDNWYTNLYYKDGIPNFNSLTLGDTFIGTGTDCNVYNSTDFGATWISVNSFGGFLSGVAYGNGKYVAVGNTGNSNCIITANATNIISYTLEPVTVQPQTYVLPAPTIDWANTNYDGVGNLNITWFSVPDATSYKVFLQISHSGYLNKYTAKATTTLNKSLTQSMFNSDSGPIIDITAKITILSTGERFNYYVFAYRNGVRSSFPSTQILDFNGVLELWPVQQVEYIGGTNWNTSFSNVTARNLYTNQSYVMSSNDWVNNWATGYASPQIPFIGTNVPISNK